MLLAGLRPSVQAEHGNDMAGNKFLRKRNPPTKSYGLLSTEILDDLYATVEASNKLNGVGVEAHDEDEVCMYACSILASLDVYYVC